jgi:hypothetical protein
MSYELWNDKYKKLRRLNKSFSAAGLLSNSQPRLTGLMSISLRMKC